MRIATYGGICALSRGYVHIAPGLALWKTPVVDTPNEILRRNLRKYVESSSRDAAEVSRAAGQNQWYIANVLSGKSGNPQASRLRLIAAEFGRTLDDLYSDDHVGAPNQLAPSRKSDQSRYVEVMTLDVRLGLGGGGSGEEDFIGEPELMPVALIEGELHGAASDFLLMEVEGTSMVPDLLSGDRVLIDRRKTNPTQPGIFALFDGFGMVAKLVERVPRSDPPQLRVLSRDPDLEPYQATLDEARIIGRVVWVARRV